MKEKIPVRCLRLHKLAEVPMTEYRLAQVPEALQDEGLRHAFIRLLRGASSDKPATQTPVPRTLQTLSFNVAAWLRLSHGENQKLSLLLNYRDASGAFGILVDEATLEGGIATMLTGCVTFTTRGSPDYLHVSCAGMQAGQRLVVDELFVQRAANSSSGLGVKGAKS